jgi:hypothetical protein
MAETLSLMEFLQALRADAELRSSFGHDPQGTLADHGLAQLSPADVHDAIVLVQDNQTVDFSLDAADTAAPPPPPPVGDDHEAAVEYLARYLSDPRQSATNETWAGADVDTDPDAGTAGPDPRDVPLETFGTGDGHWYGSGAAESPGEHASWGDGPEPGDDPYDLSGFDSGYDDLGGSEFVGSDINGADIDSFSAGQGSDLDLGA